MSARAGAVSLPAARRVELLDALADATRRLAGAVATSIHRLRLDDGRS